MGTSALIVVLAAATLGQNLRQTDIDKHNDVFKKWWGAEYEWKYDNLPTEGSVPAFRVPYSGYIYPDTAGGTQRSLRKYDMAFNDGRLRATGHEQWDTTAFKEPVRGGGGVGLFGRRLGGGFGRMAVPHWYGHCNGWTAATIRHAEPQNSVVRNGVTFTPADIKGLLAEIYIYNEMDVIAGTDFQLTPATLHTILANWLGRGKHPIGMEADPGKEKWNYPIYAFASSSARRGNEVEVKTNVAYAKDSRGEADESPRIKAVKYFHYALKLNDEGRIVGGYWYRDSSTIDMLWLPLRPKKSREPGNESGNPYVNVDEVLAIWRDSVPAEMRANWYTIDPANEDRIMELPPAPENEEDKLAELLPLQVFPVAAPAPAENAVAEGSTETAAPPAPANTPPAETAVAETAPESPAETATSAPADSTAESTESATTSEPTVPAETTPTEPAPVDSTDPEPAPTEPAPTEPAPSEPAATTDDE